MSIKIAAMKALRTAAVFTLCAAGFCLAMPSAAVHADEIVITGNAAGDLTITSGDGRLFDLHGMYPGDASSSSITVTNQDMVNQGFELAMYVESTEETEYDLGQVTKLRVARGGSEIYNGMLTAFDEEFNSVLPVNLGRVPRGENVTVNFYMEIDGDLATNEYQLQQSQFTVTFIANSYGPPSRPETTDPDSSGSSGSSDDTPFSLVSMPLAPDETVPEIVLEEGETPLSIGEVMPEPEGEPDEDEHVSIDEDEAPHGLGDVKEMPKTGEPSVLVYVISGVFLMLAGYGLLRRKTRRREI